MQDRPTAQELLGDIAGLLEDEILPALDGGLKHKARVAANLCRILARESAIGADQDTEARSALVTLLEQDRDTLELLDALDARLADDDDQDLERRARPVLLAITKAKLAVAKPGHDAYGFDGERDP